MDCRLLRSASASCLSHATDAFEPPYLSQTLVGSEHCARTSRSSRRRPVKVISLPDVASGVTFGGEGGSNNTELSLQTASPPSSAGASNDAFSSPRLDLYPVLEKEPNELDCGFEAAHSPTCRPSLVQNRNTRISPWTSLRRTQSDSDLRALDYASRKPVKSRKPWHFLRTAESQSDQESEAPKKPHLSCLSMLQGALGINSPPAAQMPSATLESSSPRTHPVDEELDSTPAQPAPPQTALKTSPAPALDAFQTGEYDRRISASARSPFEMFLGHSPPPTMRFLKELPRIKVPVRTESHNDAAVSPCNPIEDDWQTTRTHHNPRVSSTSENTSLGLMVYKVEEELTVSMGRNNRGAEAKRLKNRQAVHKESQLDSTDMYYQRALRADPRHPLLLRNYAQFIAEALGDLPRAEYWFELALAANQNDGELAAQYGKLVWDLYQDHNRASHYFDHALLASPDDGYVLAAYASFLWKSSEVDRNTGSAESAGAVCRWKT